MSLKEEYKLKFIEISKSLYTKRKQFVHRVKVNRMFNINQIGY